MSRKTLNALEITMATTQFMPTVSQESSLPAEEYFITEHQPLRMNWVVVTDDNGNRRLEMAWHVDRKG